MIYIKFHGKPFPLDNITCEVRFFFPEKSSEFYHAHHKNTEEIIYDHETGNKYLKNLANSEKVDSSVSSIQKMVVTCILFKYLHGVRLVICKALR